MDEVGINPLKYMSNAPLLQTVVDPMLIGSRTVSKPKTEVYLTGMSGALAQGAAAPVLMRFPSGHVKMATTTHECRVCWPVPLSPALGCYSCPRLAASSYKLCSFSWGVTVFGLGFLGGVPRIALGVSVCGPAGGWVLACPAP